MDESQPIVVTSGHISNTVAPSCHILSLAGNQNKSLSHVKHCHGVMQSLRVPQRFPTLFVGHGGGPLPLLNRQPDVVASFHRAVEAFPGKPTAIVVVTAHWTTAKGIGVSTGAKHPLLFDYGGFPAESYQYQYDAPGHPELAQRIIEMISKQTGIPCRGDSTRGWDHGVFVPLMCMFPAADVPVVSVSMEASLDPALHIEIGKALAPLRDENILIYGSGAICHNFEYFFTTSAAKKAEGHGFAKQWSAWLSDTLMTNESLTSEERFARMVKWPDAPGGQNMHPRGGEEHLIPLHVVLGAANGAPATTKLVANGDQASMTGDELNGFIWG